MKRNTCCAKRINLYVIAILIGICSSCSDTGSKDEEITSLEYMEAGGEMGTTFSITIKKDSTRLFMLESGGPDSVLKTKKTPTDEWKKVLNSFDLQSFKKVKDGKSNAPVDGRDEILTVRTTANNYRLVNGYLDFFHYWRIRGLTKYLRNFRNGKL